MPFAGDRAAGIGALSQLESLVTRPGDQLLLADNCGALAGVDSGPVRVVSAQGERSPSHARNAGAAASGGHWILFLDADTIVPPGLLDAYFAEPIAERVGALAGEIESAPGTGSLADRFGANRNFLGQQAHLAHPYRPRASAANLLVRRAAFDAAGGFCEGIRTAEDTDFCWRLQELGWDLEVRSEAVVRHVYRDTVRDLRRQWRSYAAGRAWLAERYPGFHPEPAVRRALRRAVRLTARSSATAGKTGAGAGDATSSLERMQFLALDVLLAVEELIGLRMSNEIRS